MLRQKQVDQDEELLRTEIQKLDDTQRKEFYKIVKTKVKDPDTYAVLNWLFITGLHHFYLGKWLMGLLDLSILIAGIILFFMGHIGLGISLIVLISLIELWALFRSQIIVQDWNNKIQYRVLNRLK